jgi:hypothetical protein
MKKIKITESQLKKLMENKDKEVKEMISADESVEINVDEENLEEMGDGNGQQEESLELNEQREKILKEFKRYL